MRGLAGYAVFALGSVLELLGLGVRLALSALGDLVEAAVGSYLLVKGFSAATSQSGADAYLALTSTSVGLTTSHATN